MKPALGMESGKEESVTVAGIPDKVQMEKTNRCSSKRIAVSVIVGVVALAAVAAVVIVSVHFGAKITTDSYKVVRQMYKTDDGIVVEEETNVTETEVDIRVPNVAEVIYDYKNGLAVQRFADREDRAQTACYAMHMNETYAPSRDANSYIDGEMDLYKTNSAGETETVKWRVTNREVPGNMVSENVARMCKGKKIYWMEKVKGEDIDKRHPCPSSYKYYYWCFKSEDYPYPCLYFCHIVFYCVVDGVEVYWKTVQGWYCLNEEICDAGANNPYCPPN